MNLDDNIIQIKSNKPNDISDVKFEQAIWKSFGNISSMAKLLDLNYSSLYGYLHRPENSEKLKLLNLSKQQIVDEAENFIKNCLSDDNIDYRAKIDLAKFILKSQGKSQGWSDSPNIAQQINVSSDKVDLKTIFGFNNDNQ